jgi:hypothetical protein
LITDVTSGVLNLNTTTGVFDYTPNTSFEGLDSFVVDVEDAKRFVTRVTVNITVEEAPVDTGPATPDTVARNVNQDTQLVSNLNEVSDPDGIDRFDLKTQATNGVAVVGPAGGFTYDPDPGYYGLDPFVVQVTDLKGFTSDVTVNVTVDPVDGGPALPATINRSTVRNIQLVSDMSPVADPDGIASYAINTQATNGTAVFTNATTGDFTYDPTPGYTGADSFTVDVTDNKGFVSVVTVDITVNQQQDGGPATPSEIGRSVNQDTQLVSDMSPVTDPDGIASFSVLTQAANGTAVYTNAATRDSTYDPDPRFFGVDQFISQVTDDLGYTSNVTVVIDVQAVDGGPATPTSVDRNTNEDTQLDSNLAEVTDPDGIASYSLNTQATNGSAVITNATTGAWSYAPNAGYYGLDSFIIDVVDVKGFSTAVTVNMTVNAVDTGPATPATIANSTEREVPLSTVLGVTDPDGIASYSIKVNPVNGAISNFNTSTGAYTYTPDNGFEGDDPYTFTITDLKGFTSDVVVTTTVTPYVDSGPATPNLFTFITDINTTLDASIGVVTDPDGLDPVPFTISQQPTDGTLDPFDQTTGDFTYTPNEDFLGIDSFLVTVLDAKGFTSVVTVAIDVKQVEQRETQILKSTGRYTNPAIAKLIPDANPIAKGSTLGITIEVYDGDNNLLSQDVLLETAPVNTYFSDWLQYVYFTWDRAHPYFISYSSEQEPNEDYRLKFEPRTESELVAISELTLTATEATDVDPVDILVLIEKLIATPQRGS